MPPPLRLSGFCILFYILSFIFLILFFMSCCKTSWPWGTNRAEVDEVSTHSNVQMDQNRGSKNKIQVVLLKYWIRTHHFGTSNWLQILNVIMLSFNVCQTLLITNSVVSGCTNVSQRITVWFTKMSRIKKIKESWQARVLSRGC